jgi:hypothetical protein
MQAWSRAIGVPATVAALSISVAHAAAVTAGDAPDRPTRVSAEYRISKAGVTIGNVSETLMRDGGAYRIVSQTSTAGPLRLFLKDRLTVVSEGRVADGGLAPMRYEFKRERDSQKNVSAEFDWTARQIVSRHGGVTEVFALPSGTLDRVSAMYQFMFSAPKADVVVTWMSQGKKAEQYRYRRVGEDVVRVGGRDLATVRFAREAKAGESKAELWLARDFNYLPTKMVFEDTNGLVLEQTLVSFSLN